MVTDESQGPEDLADPQAGTSPWLFLVPSDPPHGAWDVAHVAASLTAVQSEALAAPREVGLNLEVLQSTQRGPTPRHCCWMQTSPTTEGKSSPMK